MRTIFATIVLALVMVSTVFGQWSRTVMEGAPGQSNAYVLLDRDHIIMSNQLAVGAGDLVSSATSSTVMGLRGSAIPAPTGADTGKAYIWNGTAWTLTAPSVPTAWGAIGGTLSNQTDLWAELTNRYTKVETAGLIATASVAHAASAAYASVAGLATNAFQLNGLDASAYVTTNGSVMGGALTWPISGGTGWRVGYSMNDDGWLWMYYTPVPYYLLTFRNLTNNETVAWLSDLSPYVSNGQDNVNFGLNLTVAGNPVLTSVPIPLVLETNQTEYGWHSMLELKDTSYGSRAYFGLLKEEDDDDEDPLVIRTWYDGELGGGILFRSKDDGIEIDALDYEDDPGVLYFSRYDGRVTLFQGYPGSGLIESQVDYGNKRALSLGHHSGSYGSFCGNGYGASIGIDGDDLYALELRAGDDLSALFCVPSENYVAQFQWGNANVRLAHGSNTAINVLGGNVILGSNSVVRYGLVSSNNEVVNYQSMTNWVLTEDYARRGAPNIFTSTNYFYEDAEWQYGEGLGVEFGGHRDYLSAFHKDSKHVYVCGSKSDFHGGDPFGLLVEVGDTYLQKAFTLHDAVDGQEIVNYQTMTGFVAGASVVYADSAGYASTAGTSTYTTVSGYADTAGTSVYATVSGYADTAGYATNAGYASTAGTSTYAMVSGYASVAGYATNAGYASVAGLATNALQLGGVAAAAFPTQGQASVNFGLGLTVDGNPVLTNAPSQQPPTNWSVYPAVSDVSLAGVYAITNAAAGLWSGKSGNSGGLYWPGTDLHVYDDKTHFYDPGSSKVKFIIDVSAGALLYSQNGASLYLGNGSGLTDDYMGFDQSNGGIKFWSTNDVTFTTNNSSSGSINVEGLVKSWGIMVASNGFLFSGGNPVLTNDAQWAFYPALTNVVPAFTNLTLGTLANPFAAGYFGSNSVYLGDYAVSKTKAVGWDSTKSTVDAGAATWNTVTSKVPTNDVRYLASITNGQVAVLGGMVLTNGGNVIGTLGPDTEVFSVDQHSTSGQWYDMASSADGTKLVGVQELGYVYTSTNAGAIWTQRLSQDYWHGVASSYDGNKLVAIVSGGYIYTSTDAGVTWTQRDSSRMWEGVASSGDGRCLFAGTGAGAVFSSSDAGTNWVEQTGYNYAGGSAVADIACSYDGRIVVAVPSSGTQGAFMSYDGGTNWQNVGEAYYDSVSMSSNGSLIAAASGMNGVYVSTDAGSNWTSRIPGTTMLNISVAPAGNRIVAATPSRLYTSLDAGTNWVQRETGKVWGAAAMSYDGTRVVAGVFAGDAYTFDWYVQSGVRSELSGFGWMYWHGDANTDDSWRQGYDAATSNVVIQVRMSGVWTNAVKFVRPTP